MQNIFVLGFTTDNAEKIRIICIQRDVRVIEGMSISSRGKARGTGKMSYRKLRCGTHQFYIPCNKSSLLEGTTAVAERIKEFVTKFFKGYDLSKSYQVELITKTEETGDTTATKHRRVRKKASACSVPKCYM
jgi:hypothetical protein